MTYDAWHIAEKNFPYDGTTTEKLMFCLNYAVLAPSVYNTQPWYFKILDDTVYVYADRRYSLAMIDPDDRQLEVACAGVIYILRLAIRYFGYSEICELQPDPQDEDLMARIKLGAAKQHDDSEEKAMFKTITARHVNRGPFQDKKVDENDIKALKQIMNAMQGWMHVCNEDERRIVARLIAEGDQMQLSNKNFRREMALWVNERRRLSHDGMPDAGIVCSKIMTSFTPWAIRRFADDSGNVVADDMIEANSPVLAIMGSSAGATQERLYFGQAMMQTMLKAESMGLSMTILNQPCEVPVLRLRLHDELVNTGRAHVICRIGFAKKKPAFTPRKPMDWIVTVDDDDLKKQLKARRHAGEGNIFKKIGKLFLAKR